MTEELNQIKQFIIPLVIIACAVGSVGIATFIIVLRHRLSGIYVSRAGFQVSTNDVPDLLNIVDEICRIDTTAHKSIRKGTAGMKILDPEHYDMSDSVMLVNLRAVLPLVDAAHENHHTREIDAGENGGDMYIQDKVNDIVDVLREYKKKFNELTPDKIESFVCYWMRKVLLPSLRRACNEKVVYYNSQIFRPDISSTLRKMIVGYRNKNQRYINKIDHLANRADVEEKSAIFYTL